MNMKYLIVLSGALAACGTAQKTEQTPPDEKPPEKPELSYWQDVAPIYFERCVACHQAGGIAPFQLDRYEDAKAWGPAAVAATAARTMPPYLLTADGSCGDFFEPDVLTQAEIDLIARWVEIGAPEGEPVTLTRPDPPALEGGEAFSTPTFLPEIQGGELAEFDEYRCFRIPLGLDVDRFITGYEVVPGNEAIVHHVIGMTVDPSAQSSDGTMTNREVMDALDAESPDRDGWPCFGFAGENVAVDGVPVSWAPGQGVVDYPAGTGLRVPVDAELVLQVHYNLADESVRGQTDASTVKLRLEDRVDHEGVFILPDGFLATTFIGQPASLEPGQASVEYTWSARARDFGLRADYIDIYGVVPHMHERGRKWQFSTGSDCQARVERWDFAWQRFYFYAAPVRIEDDTRFSVTCDFDTRGADGPVLPGWGTQNEMCLAVLFLVPRNE